MKFILVLISFLGCIYTSAQLVTNTSQSPAGLVQNVLLGPGVTVSNIQYNGSATSIGSFTAANTNLGIESGIIMTTGTVLNNGSGPHGPNNKEDAGLDNGAPGINLLSNLVGGTTTYNASILEFDFVPLSDTVSFNYVFGSEEYPEFVGSEFNDVFAFFISGPGITGQQNIARLPNGSAVTINNVNAGSNSSYFVNNGDGNSSPFNGSPNYIQYDGFTRVLKAVSKVECGEQYHLVIAIADAADGLWDSGIFLEANSLSSKVEMNISQSLSYQAYPENNALAEGCVSSTVTIERSGTNLPAITIPINITGTATNGVDYTTIPSSISFTQGQNIVQFTFDALLDTQSESDETINLNFITKDACGNDVIVPLDFIIKDPSPISVVVESGGVLCPGDNLEVMASITGGVGPYNYFWSTGETSPSIFVNPTSTSVYTVNVQDNCLQTSTTASGTVTVPIYLPISLITTSPITEVCPYIPYDIEVNASGGAGNYTFEWTSNQDTMILGTDSIQNVIPNITTNYTVNVTDQCNESETASVLYTVTSPPLVLDLKEDTLICPGDSIEIWVQPSGGIPDYQYIWKHNLDTNSNVIVNPYTTKTYTVIVSDSCQTFTVEDSIKVEVTVPVADFSINSNLNFNGLPISFRNLTEGGFSYVWDFGDQQSSILTHPYHTFNDYGEFDVSLIATNEIGCVDSIQKRIEIEEAYYIYIPNTFTPDKNRYNTTFSAVTTGVNSLSILIYNRWGELMFESDDLQFKWDGVYQGVLAQQGTYIYKVNCVTNSGRELDFYGHINLLK
jgi:gliding motility-associated-like protein